MVAGRHGQHGQPAPVGGPAGRRARRRGDDARRLAARSPSRRPASSCSRARRRRCPPGAPCGSWPSGAGAAGARRSRRRSSAATTSCGCSRTCYHATARDRRVRLVSVTGQGGIGKSRLAWEFLKYIDGLVETVYWHDGRSPVLRRRASRSGRSARWSASGPASPRTTTRRRPAPGIAETVAQWVPDEQRAALDRGRAARSARRRRGAARRPGPSSSRPGGRSSSGSPTAAPGRDGLRGPPVGGQRAARVHRPPRRVEPRRARSTWSTLARPELLERGPTGVPASATSPASRSSRCRPTRCAQLLAGLVPGLPAEPPSHAIVARADGIPLYAVEIVRMLVARGLARGAQDGAYRPVGDLADLAVPETLHSLIAARLDALDPADRALLQAAVGPRPVVHGRRRSPRSPRSTTGERGAPARSRSSAGSCVDPGRRRRAPPSAASSRSSSHSSARWRTRRWRAATGRLATSPPRGTSRRSATRSWQARSRSPLPGRATATPREGPEADALAAQARIALRAAGIGRWRWAPRNRRSASTGTRWR